MAVNAMAAGVYRLTMRARLPALLICTSAWAQPQPPSFCFVLAEDNDGMWPFAREVHVVQHYRERVPYVGMNGSWLKPEESLVLHGGPLFSDTTEHWQWYRPREGMARAYVLVAAGADTMRIELPEDPGLLTQQAQQRADRDTPEVIRFRKGAFTIEHLMVDPWAVRAAEDLSRRLKEEDQRNHERTLAEQLAWQKAHPPTPTTEPAKSPPQPTAEEIMREIAQRPGLETVSVVRVDADTVWVKITGRVMLDGGCASGMPLFGIEMHTDTGWVERHAMGDAQMTCGMPWADWRDQEVMLPPLRWWVRVNSPVDRKELLPGRYRLVLMGANMERMRTEAFELVP